MSTTPLELQYFRMEPPKPPTAARRRLSKIQNTLAKSNAEFTERADRLDRAMAHDRGETGPLTSDTIADIQRRIDIALLPENRFPALRSAGSAVKLRTLSRAELDRIHRSALATLRDR
jgi:hypothetical protein